MDKLKIEDTVFSQAFVKQLNGVKEIFGIKGTSFKPLRGDIKEIQLDRLSVDFIYEVDGEKLIHFEFQSTKKNDDIYRFQLYDAHLISQYKKPIETYVIYTNDILKVKNELDYGSVKYRFNPIYMCNFSADKILKDIKDKLVLGEELTLTDIAWLEFTPLMESKISKDKVIESALELSTDIRDKEVKIQCQTILLSLALKFNVEISDELGRKIRMSPLGQKIFDEGIERGIEKAIEKMLLKGMTEEEIANILDVDVNTIIKVKDNMN